MERPLLATVGKFALLLSLSVLVCEVAARTILFAGYVGSVVTKPPTSTIDEGSKLSGSPYRLEPGWGFGLAPGVSLRELSEPAVLARIDHGDTRWLGVSTNNYGFLSNSNYPLSIEAEQCAVAITGGSVAAWLSVVSAEKLRNIFSQTAVCHGRDVKIVNLASFGFKQPQQLSIIQFFHFLGQHLDAVVNIDGFNEAALAGINQENQIPDALPSAQHLLAMRGLLSGPGPSDSIAELRYQITRAESKAERYSRLAQSAPLASLQIIGLALRRHERDRIRRLNAELLEASKQVDDSWLHIPRRSASSESIERTWGEATAALNLFLRDKNIPFIEVLQPNQYFSARKYSPEEARIALDLRSPYRPWIERFYPRFKVLGSLLRKQGLCFVDASEALDALSDLPFVDSCCHLTRSASDRVLDVVHDTITSGSQDACAVFQIKRP